MPVSQSVTLQCSACGRTFQKARSLLQAKSLAACPYCATLQVPREAHTPSPAAPERQADIRK